ncbi:PSD1 domain-containing protein [Gemmata sp. G18]|uniref:PSD1 domain-containing protein n=1 Tax=Gemmata palustris TaxID=2822762 RepID=A0ABS5BP31_9BACT|nr:PSD1 and planctomycete cytochrome C domain-containing protein [Gemmata palustris]MBP3955212.1 PSD1 domain-containing protein [Gemmata palustris]
MLVLLLAAAGTAAFAANHPRKKKPKKNKPDSVATKIDYARHVKPILEAHCYSCHGPSKSAAGLRLDTVASIRKGGDSGGVVVPGDGSRSLLVTVLTGADDQVQMPPTGEPLNAEQVAIIKAWIDDGAGASNESGAPNESAPAPRSDHWAFRPPVAAPVPAAGHPIDAFLAVGRERHGLTPNPPAPRAILLRRVYIDLIGLPPTREELSAFLADTSERAYEKVVERLLADARYGERWGRHWMDVWRYSDADGRKAKADIWWGNAHVWRWRDWIVRALNEDKRYDRMVLEMLAGDEVAGGDHTTAAATGFLVRNWFKLDRDIWLTNTVDHTAKAFLGLSLGCARCHDHKFDPVSQKEYYRFRAFFEPHDVRTDPVPGETGPAAHVARVYDAKPDEPTWVFVRGDSKAPDKSVRMPPGVPAALGAVAVAPPAAGANSTGRRLALAKWIGARENPLTARVAVNHIWMRHFGRPLVNNVADFGLRTPAPAQQQLLDWLAVEFMEREWSAKHLHRLIVTSAAYRMSSSNRGASAGNLTADPDNNFYWRANSRRMEAEAVRDSLLWLAGALEPTAGGPPVDPARGTETGRRSLYYRYSREDKMDLLLAFDAPGVEECYRREQSIVPQQALALENSAFSWDQARRIARRLERDAPAPAAFVPAAFEHVLGRPPTAAEGAACEAFLARQQALLADPNGLTPLPLPPEPVKLDPEAAKQLATRVRGLPLVLGDAKPLPPVPPAAGPVARAREYLVHALLNHNDFITVR